MTQDLAGGYYVKGSTLRTKLDFVREVFGEKAEGSLRERLLTEGLTSVLDSEWYPFALYDAVNRAIADLHFAGDLSRLVEVGRYSAGRALSTVYRPYARAGSFHAFLRKIASLHRTLYSRGRLDVEADEGDHAATMLLSEAPHYSPADLYIAQGFYMGCAEHFGLAGLYCTHELSPGGARVDIHWR